MLDNYWNMRKKNFTLVLCTSAVQNWMTFYLDDTVYEFVMVYLNTYDD